MKARIPQSMGGGMQSMLKQAQKMQEEVQAKQEEIEAKIFDISAGGGAVNIKINGKKEFLEISIDEDIIDPDDPETLQDILVAGCNEAIKRVDGELQEELSKITGSIPGLPGFGGF